MDLSRSAIDRRLSKFRDQCAARKLALTPQRLAIFGILARDDSHPTADDVYTRLKPELPSLSRGTVYRTLELLEAHGLVRRVPTGGDCARFDAETDEHAHLVCEQCGAVRDLGQAEWPAPADPPKRLHGFRILGQRVQVIGICARCWKSPLAADRNHS